MADSKSTKRMALGLLAGLVAVAFVVWVGGRKGPSETSQPSSPDASAATSVAADASVARSVMGLPIAATHGANGDIIVAAFDTPSSYLRVQRLDVSGRVVRDRPILGSVSWSSDAELKISAHPTEGIAVTWRGMHRSKRERYLIVLDQALIPQGEPKSVSGTSCTTNDAVWATDGAFALSRPWNAPPAKIALPIDEEVSLLCASSRAFAVLEGDERTALLPLEAQDAKASPTNIFRERDFGDDDQRELAEYTVGDDVGVVRVGVSGNVTVRELGSTGLRPVRKLKTSLPKEADVVAVDASERMLAIVFAEDVSASCPSTDKGSSTSTKVSVLRVDRKSFEESTVEASPGRCGDELGPFFTGAVGEHVSVAWVERRGGAGKARAPIAGLAHARLGPEGVPTFARIEQPADVIVDAGCDANGCYAAALVPDVQGGAPLLRPLRYSTAR